MVLPYDCLFTRFPRKCFPAPIKLQDGGGLLQDRMFAVLLTVALFGVFEVQKSVLELKPIASVTVHTDLHYIYIYLNSKAVSVCRVRHRVSARAVSSPFSQRVTQLCCYFWSLTHAPSLPPSLPLTAPYCMTSQTGSDQRNAQRCRGVWFDANDGHWCRAKPQHRTVAVRRLAPRTVTV